MQRIVNTPVKIEGFEDREGSPVVIEVHKGVGRSSDGAYQFLEEQETAARARRTWSGTPFTAFLEKLSDDAGKEYVLFLVRPDGITTYKVLRDTLVFRNDDLCEASAPAGPSGDAQRPLAGLDQTLRRKVRIADGKIIFSGPMSSGDRDAIGGLIGPLNAAVLYQKALRSRHCVDYGVDLAPAGWSLETDAQGQLQLLPAKR